MQAIHVVKLGWVGLKGAFHLLSHATAEINTIFGMGIILQKLCIHSLHPIVSTMHRFALLSAWRSSWKCEEMKEFEWVAREFDLVLGLYLWVLIKTNKKELINVKYYWSLTFSNSLRFTKSAHSQFLISKKVGKTENPVIENSEIAFPMVKLLAANPSCIPSQKSKKREYDLFSSRRITHDLVQIMP